MDDVEKGTKPAAYQDQDSSPRIGGACFADEEACLRLVTAPHFSDYSVGSRIASVLLCLKPVDRWTLGYLLVTAPLLFVAENLGSVLWTAVLLRLGLIPLVIYFRQFAAQKRSPKELFLGLSWHGASVDPPIAVLYWVLDWYPALMYGYLYSETGQIIANVHGSVRHDDDMKRYEQEFFFAQPARDLREWLPSRLLGEYLHFCYFTYYAIIVAMMAVIYLFRPREYFDRAASALSLGFFTCFVMYIVYPVEGPYWSFPRPEPDKVSYFFAHVVHFVLAASSKGTAMPSSHCAISMVCWIAAWVYHKRLAFAFLFLVPGLIFATVWCGFHYGLDSTTGTVWGIVCAVAGILLAKYMPYSRPVHDKAYGNKSRQPLRAIAKWI